MMTQKTKEQEEKDWMDYLTRCHYEELRERLLVDIVRRGYEVRLTRRLQQEKHQEKLEQNIFKERELKEKQASEKDINQQKVMAEQNQATEDLRKEKLKQQLRLGTQEIRDLESQLRACYVGKGLHTQMKEKEVQRVREALREKAHLEAQLIAWKEQEDNEKRKQEDEMREKYAIRLAQQEQMIQKQKQKVEAYRAFVQEKLMLDAVVQELIEEDRKNSLARLLRQKAHRKEIDRFLAAQEEWKEHQRKELEEENKRINAFVEMQTNRELQNQLEIQRKCESHAQINDHLCRKLYEEKMQNVEKQQILQQLAEAELYESQEARIRQELQVAVQKRIDLRLAIEHQQKERLIHLQREAQQEQQMRQEMMEERARQDRLDQLSKERRRIKVQEHRQAVELLLQQRRVHRNLELEQIMRDHEAQVADEKARERMIEEERIRILQQHAENLLGFMPKGLLKQSDIEKLGSRFS